MTKSKGRRPSEVKMIPIDRINILNPRARNQKVFIEIATNMTQVGMKRPITVTPMESEMECLQREYRLIEEDYGKDVLRLTLTKGYLGALLGNAKVVRYLAQNHADILMQFQKIADISSLAKETTA